VTAIGYPASVRVIALVVALSGCGLTRTRGPGQLTDANGRAVCTTSMDAPKQDGIVAVVGLVAVVFGAVSIGADNSDVGAPLLIGGIATMAVAYTSGGVGYYRVKKCRKAQDDFDRAHPRPPPTDAVFP